MDIAVVYYDVIQVCENLTRFAFFIQLVERKLQVIILFKAEFSFLGGFAILDYVSRQKSAPLSEVLLLVLTEPSGIVCELLLTSLARAHPSVGLIIAYIIGTMAPRSPI